MVNQRTMDAERFHEALEQLGFTIRGLAYFFGVAERTVLRWIEGDHVPRPNAMVMQLMVAKKLSAEEVLTIAKVRPAQLKFILSHLYDRRSPEKHAEG